MSDPNSDVRSVDPFGPAAASAAYVPFAAAERALQSVEATLRAGHVAMLVGPPGLGKTMLLHQVSVRQEPLQAFHVPFCTLSLSEICSLVLRLFEWDVGTDPVISVAQHAQSLRAQGSGLLLLIDDAGAMPVETAFGLAALFDLADGSIRIVMAADEKEQAANVTAAFASRLDCVLLDEGMSAEETRFYVTSRLDFAASDDALRAAFDAETIDALHRSSGGVPRRVNAAAQAIAREALDEAIPTSGSAQPAPDRSPPVAAATLSAMLAREPDIQDVLDLLSDGGQPAQTPDPDTRPPEGVRAPSTEPASGTAAKPSATATAADTERGVHTMEPETSPAESLIGTYRMPRSGITERPHERDEASAKRSTPAAPAPDPTTATALKSRQPAAALTAKPASTVARDAEISPKSGPHRTRRRVLAAVGAAFIVAGFLWVTFDPGAWILPDAPSNRLPPATPAPAPASEVESAPIAVSPKPEPTQTPIVSRETEPISIRTPDTPTPAGTPSREEISVESDAESLAATTPDADPSVAITEPAQEAATAVIFVEGVTAAEEIADPDVPGSESEPAPEPDATVAIESLVEPAVVESPVEEPEAVPATPAIIRIGIDAVPWALIDVDGFELGETPLDDIGIPAGEHTFRAHMPDGSVREKTVTIDASNRRVVFE